MRGQVQPWDGSANAPRQMVFQRAIGSGTDNYNGTAGLVGGTWANAPAGEYLIHSTFAVSAGSIFAGVLIINANGVTISQPNHRADVPSAVTAVYTNTHAYTHPGGNMPVELAHSVGGNTATVHNATTKLIVQRLT